MRYNIKILSLIFFFFLQRCYQEIFCLHQEFTNCLYINCDISLNVINKLFRYNSNDLCIYIFVLTPFFWILPSVPIVYSTELSMTKLSYILNTKTLNLLSWIQLKVNWFYLALSYYFLEIILLPSHCLSSY